MRAECGNCRRRGQASTTSRTMPPLVQSRETGAVPGIRRRLRVIVAPVPICLPVVLFQPAIVPVRSVLVGFPMGVRLPFRPTPPVIVRVWCIVVARTDGTSGNGYQAEHEYRDQTTLQIMHCMSHPGIQACESPWCSSSTLCAHGSFSVAISA
jgi:hypothetical protein